ncbi:MAG: hypothetical protein HS101_07850 [Planctomycetia bacterium]|nr:hypothetical protein [Planctomycetia bacterium]
MADETIAVTAIRDAFVREQDAPSNFGGGGLLCVAGQDSVNEVEQPRGRFDSVVVFDLTSAVALFDLSFGTQQWVITNVELQLAHVVVPDNPLFPRGIGNFQVLWFSEDTWTEGTGSPNAPTQNGGDEMSWQFLQSLLVTATEGPLGSFLTSGVTGVHVYELALDTNFVTDIAAGGMVSLHFVPQSADLGFTLRSRNFGDSAQRPKLLITAARFILGDLNCDTIVDIQDLEPFVQCLMDPVLYSSLHLGCEPTQADFNDDGSVDGADIAGFAEALLSP